MKDYRITVRFPPELRRRLQEAARRSKRRESDLIRSAVEQKLTADEHVSTAYDLVAKAGLIGAVRSGVGDLSTKHKHFDGFGES